MLQIIFIPSLLIFLSAYANSNTAFEEDLEGFVVITKLPDNDSFVPIQTTEINSDSTPEDSSQRTNTDNDSFVPIEITGINSDSTLIHEDSTPEDSSQERINATMPLFLITQDDFHIRNLLRTDTQKVKKIVYPSIHKQRH